jgi:GNAT superfamily N-acetyltransferase
MLGGGANGLFGELFFASQPVTNARDCLVAPVPMVPQSLLAFINLSLHYEYVPGATQNPVAYVEGIYVLDGYRHQGVAKALIQFAEQRQLRTDVLNFTPINKHGVARATHLYQQV